MLVMDPKVTFLVVEEKSPIIILEGSIAVSSAGYCLGGARYISICSPGQTGNCSFHDVAI